MAQGNALSGFGAQDGGAAGRTQVAFPQLIWHVYGLLGTGVVGAGLLLYQRLTVAGDGTLSTLGYNELRAACTTVVAFSGFVGQRLPSARFS